MFWVRLDLDSGKNFNFMGGGCSVPNSRTGVFWEIWSKISGSLAGWCITDNLLHTTYMETKNRLPTSMRNQRTFRYIKGHCVFSRPITNHFIQVVSYDKALLHVIFKQKMMIPRKQWKIKETCVQFYCEKDVKCYCWEDQLAMHNLI